MSEANPVRNAGYAAVVLPFVVLAALAVLAMIDAHYVIEENVADFFIITIMLGGWAAWRAGRSLASTWRPYWSVLVYMLPFALAVRWIHFALFEGTLFSLHHYVIDYLVVVSFATIGYRVVRTRQMTTQYRWLYRKTGLFTWARAVEP